MFEPIKSFVRLAQETARALARGVYSPNESERATLRITNGLKGLCALGEINNRELMLEDEQNQLTRTLEAMLLLESNEKEFRDIIVRALEGRLPSWALIDIRGEASQNDKAQT